MTGIGLRAADSVHAREFDGELVILDMERGEYFALDEIGARYWAAIESDSSEEALLDEIVSEYDVTREQASADLRALRDELLERRLVVPKE
nr:hypothetical protein Hi04_10k_c3883_00010 [uncultured bacterium]